MFMLATPVAGLVLMVSLEKVEEWLLGREDGAGRQPDSAPRVRSGGVEHVATGGVAQRRGGEERAQQRVPVDLR